MARPSSRSGGRLALSLLAASALAFAITYAIDPLSADLGADPAPPSERSPPPRPRVPERLTPDPTSWPAWPPGPPVPEHAAITLPLIGALDILAVEASAQDTNPHGLLRSALQKFVSRALRSARGCMPADAKPSMTRFHLRVRSQAHGRAEVLEVLDLVVQRGAPLSEAATSCLLTSLREGLPQPLPSLSPASLPDFDGDATVLAALKLDPACGI